MIIKNNVDKKQSKIEDIVEKTILQEKLIQNGDRIVVGVSGGPDSMCLLNVLNVLKVKFEKEYDIKYSLAVAHINHSIREESETEKLYVENFCKEANIEFYYLKENVPELSKKMKISEETCGRHVRYNFFKEVLEQTKSQKIAVAHNLDDNIETILLNIIRGTGLNGLIGMSYITDNIIRPLLDIEKKDILEYNIKEELNPCFDKTNEEEIYVRNKIRLNLIPKIKEEYNENITQNISRMQKILKKDEEFLDNYTKTVINSCILENNTKDIKFDYSSILKGHDSIKTRGVREIIKLKNKNLDGIENIHVLDILKLFERNITGKKYILGNKFTIEIVKKNIAVIY